MRLGNTYGSVYWVPCSEKQALFSLKLFHFCLCGRWHFWFQSGTFGDDLQVPLSWFSIVSLRSAFTVLAIVCFPEFLHTQGLHKFVGSISGVVYMNSACILKMILGWIHLGRPLCYRCKNFKASCRYTLFTVRMSRMLSRWRVLSVCLCKTSACLFSSGRSIIAEEMHRWNASSPLLC